MSLVLGMMRVWLVPALFKRMHIHCWAWWGFSLFQHYSRECTLLFFNRNFENHKINQHMFQKLERNDKLLKFVSTISDHISSVSKYCIAKTRMTLILTEKRLLSPPRTIGNCAAYYRMLANTPSYLVVFSAITVNNWLFANEYRRSRFSTNSKFISSYPSTEWLKIKGHKTAVSLCCYSSVMSSCEPRYGRVNLWLDWLSVNSCIDKHRDIDQSDETMRLNWKKQVTAHINGILQAHYQYLSDKCLDFIEHYWHF